MEKRRSCFCGLRRSCDQHIPEDGAAILLGAGQNGRRLGRRVIFLIRKGAGLLTRKQQAWLDSVAQGFSPDEAARRAGYRGDSAADFRRIGKRNQQRFARRTADDVPRDRQGSTGSARRFDGRSEAGDSGSVGFLEGQNTSYKELKDYTQQTGQSEPTVPDEAVMEPVSDERECLDYALKELKRPRKRGGMRNPEPAANCAGDLDNSYKEVKRYHAGDGEGEPEPGPAAECAGRFYDSFKELNEYEKEDKAGDPAVLEEAAEDTERDRPGDQPPREKAAEEYEPGPAALKNMADGCVGDLNHAYKEVKEYRAGDGEGEPEPEPAALKNAGMDEIGAFWSALIRDPHADRKDRLKASELLARACGGFLDRTDLSGTLTVVIYGDDLIPD